jgi:hypothetical protein
VAGGGGSESRALVTVTEYSVTRDAGLGPAESGAGPAAPDSEAAGPAGPQADLDAGRTGPGLDSDGA